LALSARHQEPVGLQSLALSQTRSAHGVRRQFRGPAAWKPAPRYPRASEEWDQSSYLRSGMAIGPRLSRHDDPDFQSEPDQPEFIERFRFFGRRRAKVESALGTGCEDSGPHAIRRPGQEAGSRSAGARAREELG